MAEPSRQGAPLPTGTLTFLFSDIEGSTQLVQSLGGRFAPLLERHQALLRRAFLDAGGVEVATEGDSFFVVFASAIEAVKAAASAQRALSAEAWAPEAGAVRVRMGLHTGEAALGGDNYVGLDVHRAARIAAAAHGGQVLVSDTTRALVASSLPADLGLRDLQEHRLKDLDRPEHLFQLLVVGLPDGFPPPDTLESPTNLPAQPTAFIGRRREADEVADLVRRSRLVTLVGPGGTGKTRLSLEVAARLRPEFRGGAFFVDLSLISDPTLVPTTIATALGVLEQAGKPLLESLMAHLRNLQLLLVLDNFEQVESAATLVGQLFEAAPQLSLLVTSREALHLRGEHEYPVPPLGLPSLANLPPLEALSQYDAVALFIQRAQAVRPDFAIDNDNAPAVAGICARLDGLPLAIELAAARLKVLSPEAIFGRLEKSLSILTSASRDLTDRQRTLRGAIDWSHDLLVAGERTLFRRLGVFVGGCTIERGEAICDPNATMGMDMLDGLSSLVDKSLLRQPSETSGEPRFRMLETIRDYALERLIESEDWDPVRHAHEDQFAALARQGAAEMQGVNHQAWVDRLEGERDNLRAALQRLADDGRIQEALEMGADLWRFWQRRGSLAEGRATLEELLSRPGADAPTAARARGLSALGGLQYWRSDMEAARRAYDEGLRIERSLDDPAGLAEALYNLGFVVALAGDHAGARALSEEGLEIATRIGNRSLVLGLREALAFQMFHMGEVERARELQEANLAAFRDAGETFRVAIGTGFVSYLEARAGRYEIARSMQRESFHTFRAANDSHWMVRSLMLAGASAVVAGEFERAATFNGAYDRLREPLGEMATPIRTLNLADPATEAHAALGDEAFERAYAAGRAMTIDEVEALI